LSIGDAGRFSRENAMNKNQKQPARGFWDWLLGGGWGDGGVKG
jgi:hypothetical protein